VLRSRYQNCFYYFRGPSSKQKAADLYKQLEDKTTKALINVLEHSNRNLTRSFLDSLVGWKGTASEFEYFLQAGPDSPATAKLLLALSNGGEIGASSWTLDDGGSRVDGSIHSAGTLTLLIETKVVDTLNGSQLQRHAREWGIPEAEANEDQWRLPPEWKIKKWVDVYEWAQRESQTTERQPDKYLLGQLVEYLELTGLAPTWTLRAEHFDFFSKPAEERDAALGAEIRARLASIWSKVKEELGLDFFRDVLGEVHVGNLGEGADGAWAQTNADAGSHVPNLTIELDANELNLNVVGGFDRQAECVERWLLAGGGAGLAASSFELAVFCRTAKGGRNGKKIVWQGAKWSLVERTPLSKLTPTVIKARLAELRKPLEDKTQRLAFHIRKAWRRDAVLERKDLPAELAREIKQLLPTLKEIRRA
jgi:hypothetical protein